MQFVPRDYHDVRPSVQVGGSTVVLEWARGKVYDAGAARKAHAAVQSARFARCVSVDRSPRTLRRPTALNTVQLLRACSSGLGLSPVKAMKLAESLYSHGYISYPRTESSRYPASFDVTQVLREQANHPGWGKTASWILRHHGGRVPVPTDGTDVGDHPPITPCKIAVREEFEKKHQEWRVYEFVTRHFLGSLMSDVAYEALSYVFDVGGERFSVKRFNVTDRGFLFALPHMAREMARRERPEGEDAAAAKRKSGPPDRTDEEILQCAVGDTVQHLGADLLTQWTTPPPYLTEAQLIARMDAHGIGTDASIPQHVENVVNRKYVAVCNDPFGLGRAFGRKVDWNRIDEPAAGEGRFMVPTEMGVSFIHAFQAADPELVAPAVRAHIESEVSKIADGARLRSEVVSANLRMFKEKFLAFRANTPRSVAGLFSADGPREPGPRGRYAQAFLDQYYDECRAKRQQEVEKRQYLRSIGKGGKGPRMKATGDRKKGGKGWSGVSKGGKKGGKKGAKR
eukprot:TRINITY_DN11478_c0_g1_i4.p1 TRINITY_DN11478_c0_g1~~TRINITY_DN11478_c0_g1_i4.p1  ORF type:complete len:512 (+),score=111.90 TRINITY_DN11478_c0_g1_i4:1062-2597(+)